MSMWQRFTSALIRLLAFVTFTRRIQAEHELTRHEQCLANIKRLERELGMLSALSDAEFDAEVRAVTEQHERQAIEEETRQPLPPGVDSDKWGREEAFRIWRTQNPWSR